MPDSIRHHPFAAGAGGDLRIRGLAAEPLDDVLRLMPASLEPAAQSRRKLRVNEETHQAACTTE